MALGLSQPLSEMSTWGKGGLCVGLTNLSACADSLEIWEPQPSGTLQACRSFALSLTFTCKLAAPDAHTRTHTPTRLILTTQFTAAVTPDTLMLQQLCEFHGLVSLCYS